MIRSLRTILRPLLTSWLCLLLASTVQVLHAQEPASRYTVRNGRMYIELSKKIMEPSLDSFIQQFDLTELALKDFVYRNMRDSLLKQGWVLEKSTSDFFIISKPLLGFDRIKDPAEKILFTEKHLTGGNIFPSVSSKVVYGVNRFKNKHNFLLRDSVVTFFLRNQKNARQVMLAGSFNNWGPEALSMKRTDSGWIADVTLQPGKYWYKFIVDDNWIVDTDNRLRENDGEGNVNSVYFQPNYLIHLDSFVKARRVYVAGSFNEWGEIELPMEKKDNGWQLPIYLADGTHTYRFIVDGRWMADPFNPNAVPNEFGETNSLIQLGKPTIFRLDGYADAKEVMLLGSFNQWRRNELYMKKVGDGWQLPYYIGPGNYEYQFVVDGKTLGSPEGNGNLTFIVKPNYTFRLKGFADAKQVYLAGDFNNWAPNAFPMIKDGDEWKLAVHLSPGKHTYKFVVDGKWILDPDNKLWEQNEYDTGNSVLWKEND